MPQQAGLQNNGEEDLVTSKSPEHDQRALYDAIADEYQAHFGDKYSLLYRDRFMNRFLFAGISISGKKVLDAACGGGETSAYLVAQGANVTGLDISARMVDWFKAKFPSAEGVCASVLSTGFDDDTFDCVSMVGGLHHLHPNTEKAIGEVHRILKPGGFFCFCEPPTGTLPDIVRRVWYARDRSAFAENEGAIDTDAILRRNTAKFRMISQRYGGSIAYLMVLNSLHFRVPLAIKRLYSPITMFMESVITRFQPRLLSCFVVCQWQKTGGNGRGCLAQPP